VIDSLDDEDNPFLSDDRLTLYYDTNQDGLAQIYIAKRTAPGQPFGAGLPVTELGSSLIDETPDLVAGELTIYFASTRGGSEDVWRAQRSSPTGAFGTPTRVDSVSSSAEDVAPTTFPDGTLLFVSDRQGASFLFTAAPSGNDFAAPVLFSEASGMPGVSDVDPFITRDGKTLLFASERSGVFDLYTMERACQ
jgi:Tol biopolymer transport system component